MSTEIIIAIIAGLSAAIPSIITTIYKTNKSNESREAILDQKLLQMNEKLDELKVKFDIFNNKTEELKERLVLVEASVKSAHKRIDSLENNKK